MSQTESFDQSHAITLSGGAAGGAERQLRPGEIIGGSYVLKSLLGRGGMGYVFCAEHNIIGHQYALKMLAPELLNEASRRRFETEGRAIANLNHVNIVKVYNMGLDRGDCPFYVMDLLDGHALSEYIAAKKRMPLNQLLDILTQIAAGLDYAHGKGIVHRDVKPSNVVLLSEKDGHLCVKIVDFGIAKLLPSANLHSQSQTATGEVFGSPLYMSPEQCMGNTVDARSDIYSLGCTLFEMLTGAPPFHGANAMETVMMHQNCPVPSVLQTQTGQDLPPALDLLLAKMMAKGPEDRYQSMQQLIHDVERIRQGKSIGKMAAAETTAPGPVKAAARTSVQTATEHVTGPTEQQSGKDNQGRKKITAGGAVLMVGVVLVSIGAVCFGPGLLQRFAGKGGSVVGGAQTLATRPASPSALPKLDPGIDDKLFNIHDFNNRLAPGTSDKDLAEAQESYKQIHLIKSSLRTVKGVKVRHFVFPTWPIGRISGHRSGQQVAAGPIDVAANEALDLTVGSPVKAEFVLVYPTIFNQIEVSEFSCLTLDGDSLQLFMGMADKEQPHGGSWPPILKRAAAWTNLRRLVLKSIHIGKSDFAAINKLAHMQAIELIRARFDSQALASQPFLNRMKYVNFNEVVGLQPVLKVLAQSTKLNELTIYECCLTPLELWEMHRSTSLQVLQLRFVKRKQAPFREPVRVMKGED